MSLRRAVCASLVLAASLACRVEPPVDPEDARPVEPPATVAEVIPDEEPAIARVAEPGPPVGGQADAPGL